MRTSRRRYAAFTGLLLAIALIAAACGGSGPTSSSSGGQPKQGGTLTFGAQQFPANQNCYLATNNLGWCYEMQEATILGAYQVQPDFAYHPSLVTSADVGKSPFSVTYHIDPKAQWSDKVPVTSADFDFTWKTIMDPHNKVVSNAGYDQIASDQIIDDKTIKFTFKKVFAPWQTLFTGTDGVYPEHVLKGQDWNTAWLKCVCDPKTGKPIADGPFLLTEFKKNQSITLERNPNWWGPHAPYLDKIVFNYVPNSSTEIQQLRGSEVDAIYPTVQLELKSLKSLSGVTVQAVAGTFWQHLDFNFHNPMLKQLWVRQAIAYGIDRQAIVDKLLKPIQPDAPVLQNLIYVANQKEYEPHFQMYNHDPTKSEQIMTSHGCKKGSDGVYVCNGTKMEFGYKSTAGDELRELMFQIIQANLKDVGIKLDNQFGETSVVFGAKGLTGGVYDLFQFGWVGNPDPFGGNEIWKCNGDQNYNNYCNPAVTKLLTKTDSEVDPAQRAATYNQADALMAKDLPVLPLWQAPDPLAFQDYIHGFQDNATQEGPIWNAADLWTDHNTQ